MPVAKLAIEAAKYGARKLIKKAAKKRVAAKAEKKAAKLVKGHGKYLKRKKAASKKKK